jgi:hypothetical protein
VLTVDDDKKRVSNVRTLFAGSSSREQVAHVDLPDWTQGTWLTAGSPGINAPSVQINRTQLIITNSADRNILYDLRLTRVRSSKRLRKNVLLLKAYSLERW